MFGLLAGQTKNCEGVTLGSGQWRKEDRKSVHKYEHSYITQSFGYFLTVNNKVFVFLNLQSKLLSTPALFCSVDIFTNQTANKWMEKIISRLMKVAVQYKIAQPTECEDDAFTIM